MQTAAQPAALAEADIAAATALPEHQKGPGMLRGQTLQRAYAYALLAHAAAVLEAAAP